jgi:hypothetical protein
MPVVVNAPEGHQREQSDHVRRRDYPCGRDALRPATADLSVGERRRERGPAWESETDGVLSQDQT